MVGGDTIIAQASAPGRGERAIVRLSGPSVPALLRALIRPQPAGRGVSLCSLSVRDGPPPLACAALLLRFPAPASYTGEESAELILPGNPHLVERVIERCCAHEGVRRAGPGEFTARAYLGGRLTLAEAEGVAAVIAAQNAADLQVASRLASGETGALYAQWAEEIVSLLALVEAGIDFTDQEDVVPIRPRELRRRLEVLREAMLSRAAGQGAERSGGLLPLVALVGPPNAGKSTLFNALLGRVRSIAHDEAGTTRDMIVEELHLDEAAGPGLAVRLADLPGLDHADAGPAAHAAQERAREALSQADALLHCDPLARFAGEAWPTPPGTPVLRVRTKADLPGSGGGDIEVCALDGWRLDVLRRGIADIALAGVASSAVALERHGCALGQAATGLAQLLARLDPGRESLESPELVAEGLRAALGRLEEVLGRVTPDEVIGRIFATFCVGK
jgi:tRNA modification GTPase